MSEPTPHKAIVESYVEGFRRGDHAQVLACLTEDVVWDLPGYKHLTGRQAFDLEIENEEFVGHPQLTIDRLVEEGDTVVAIGRGGGTRRGGEAFRFAFTDVFTFRGDQICRVESYLVLLPSDQA